VCVCVCMCACVCVREREREASIWRSAATSRNVDKLAYFNSVFLWSFYLTPYMGILRFRSRDLGGEWSGIVPMGKDLMCPLDRRANGCRKSSGRCEKNLISCCESNPHLVSWLRTSGPILPLPLYASMAFIVTTAPSLSIGMFISC
jgi:hypothetical protein